VKSRTLAIIAGVSYLIIFFSAVFANFFVLESILKDPSGFILQNPKMVRSGIMAFMITVSFDVVVAWTLFELYRKHSLALLSTFFRMMHAVIMGVAVFALPMTLTMATDREILAQVDIFNTIWLIGLFFFGIHLVLLGKIIERMKIIAIFLSIAGLMYMVDTAAHFLLPAYEAWTPVFLALVAIPSIVGEMSFAVWLLVKGGRSA